jgi:hypothetical protein
MLGFLLPASLVSWIAETVKNRVNGRDKAKIAN